MKKGEIEKDFISKLNYIFSDGSEEEALIKQRFLNDFYDRNKNNSLEHINLIYDGYKQVWENKDFVCEQVSKKFGIKYWCNN